MFLFSVINIIFVTFENLMINVILRKLYNITVQLSDSFQSHFQNGAVTFYILRISQERFISVTKHIYLKRHITNVIMGSIP